MAQAPQPFLDETAGEPPVRGFLHFPETPSGDGLVLTHGAGANCQAPLLVALAQSFAAARAVVLRCDLPFRQLRPHGPPPRGSAAADQQGLRRAVSLLRRLVPGRIFLGGHSYGGRQATLAVASGPEFVHGLLLLSYPLHPPNRPAELRSAHFPQLSVPALFVHGSRDAFASLTEMEAAIGLIPAPTRLLAVPGQGHSLFAGTLRAQLPELVLKTFEAFFGKQAQNP